MQNEKFFISFRVVFYTTKASTMLGCHKQVDIYVFQFHLKNISRVVSDDKFYAFGFFSLVAQQEAAKEEGRKYHHKYQHLTH